MTALHLMRPYWLWAAVPAAVLIVLLWRQRGRSGSWHAVIAPELLRYLVGDNDGARSVNWLPLILVGWLLAALAASGPSWEKIPQPIHQKQDAVVLLLDLSYSMKSSDLAPSRLDRARQKLLDLLRLRREGQTGLIAYAGDTHIVTPLTDDTPTIANLLPALQPDMMPVPGSEPADAITQGLQLLHSAGIRQGKLLLVTDGITDKDSKAIARAMNRSDAQLSIMGVGTATGAPIPLPQGGFVKDASGAIVMPQLKEGNLRELATKSGGRYMRMQINDNDLDYLLAENPLASSEQMLDLDRTADTWEDLGYLFILPLLPLVLALFRRGALLTLLPLMLPVLLLGQAQPAKAQTWDDLWLTPDQQGQRALEHGDDEDAANLFNDPAWAGTAAYRSGDFESAAEDFSTSENADSWYNRGNALARSGNLDEAIAAYQESLKLTPDQADAQKNLKLLEDMKKQQQQQQQQKQKQPKQQQQQNQQGDESQEQGQPDQEQNQQQGQPQDQKKSDEENTDKSSQQNSQHNDASHQEQQQQTNQSQQDEENEQQQDHEQQASAEPKEEKGEPDEEQPALAAQASPEEMERDQAMKQWLRRVPDDPSGLLREKFRYESRQRQAEGAQKDNEIYW